MGLLRTLLFIIAVVLIVRWFKNLIMPEPKSAQRNTQANSRKDEGTTTIRFNKKGEKIIDKDKGEFVDFEEVD